MENRTPPTYPTNVLPQRTPPNGLLSSTVDLSTQLRALIANRNPYEENLIFSPMHLEAAYFATMESGAYPLFFALPAYLLIFIAIGSAEVDSTDRDARCSQRFLSCDGEAAILLFERVLVIRQVL